MSRAIVVRNGLLSAVLGIGLSLPALAQGVGSIVGTVMDSSGAVLPGATVTLSNPGTIGGSQNVVTDERGAFQFTRLVPGTYRVAAELQGFRRTVQGNLVVNADAAARVDLKLSIGAVEEDVTVTAEAPLLDTTSAVRQTVMSRDVIDSLPARNDVWSIGRMAPAVVMGKIDVAGTSAFAQVTAYVHGSNPGENAYLIDGMDLSNPNYLASGTLAGYFDPFMFQEIDYQTGNAPAERPMGGVVYNMIPKTGTNTVHGSYMFTGASHGMNFNNISPTLRQQLLAAVPAKALVANPNLVPANDILSVYDTGATVGGPIVQDRLWFFMTAKYGILNQHLFGSYNVNGQQVLDDNRMRNISGKISWQATKNSQVHWLYNWNDRGQFHRNIAAAGGFVDSNATYFGDIYNNMNVARWTSVLSSKIVMDVSFSMLNGEYRAPPQPVVALGTIPKHDIVLNTFTDAVSTYQEQPNLRKNLLASLSYAGGRHDLKVGYWFNHGHGETYTYSLSSYPSGLLANYRGGVPDSVNTFNTPTDYTQVFHGNAVYIQDKWVPVRKLTLNLGLRFQETYGYEPATCQPATIFIQGQCFPAITNAPNWKTVVPRMSAIYDVFGDGKTALKFSANRYATDPGVPYINTINPILATSDTRAWTVCATGQTSACDLTGDGIPQPNELGASTGFALGTANKFDPNIQWPYVNEVSVGIERQLPAQSMISITYYYRGSRNNIGGTNLAVPASSYIPLQVTEVTSGQQVTVYNQDPTLRGKFAFLFANIPQFNTNFNGVDLNFTKRMSHRWMAVAGLSLGHNVGDIFGSSLSIAGFSSLTANLNNPNFAFRNGVMSNDVPVAIKVSGVYQLPLDISISGSAQHFTGFPELTTVLVGSNTVTLTQVTQSIVVQPAGTTRAPSVNLLDISLRRTLKRGNLNVEPVMDVFNLFNSATTLSEITQLGPTHDRPLSILQGRLIKLGVNVRF